MKLMQKIIHAGFATCAVASASMPALSWTTWPSLDFEWRAEPGAMPTMPGAPTMTAALEVSPALQDALPELDPSDSRR
jgi:hypothetical protein